MFLSVLAKATKLKDQLEACRNAKLWQILEEYVASDLDPKILVLSLAILSNLCFDDECCVQIRLHCAYCVCQLLMRHIPKLHPSIKGQYVRQYSLIINRIKILY